MRASTLPESSEDRKRFPVASGVLDYFPDALVAVAEVSQRANDQHNPGQPLHWNRAKSTDEADTMIRHFLQRGSLDVDGLRHTAKMAWRALALLQKEIEAESQVVLTHDEWCVREGYPGHALPYDPCMTKGCTIEMGYQTYLKQATGASE